MNGFRFDTVVQNLKRESSRRRLLGGILVGTTSLVTGISLTEAKRGGNGKGKAKGRGRGKSKGKGAGTVKVQFCHRAKKGESFELITVGSPAANAHMKHGDVQCEAGTCQTGQATGCNADGTCVFAQAEAGTTCTLNGASGLCTAEGVCDTSGG